MGTLAEVSAQTITPKDAVEWLVTFAYPYQRPLRESGVQRFSAMMEAGNFKEGTTLVLAHCKESDSIYLIDGQHRLSAGAKSGTTQTYIVREIICDTLDDVAREYIAIDQPNVRGFPDLVRALRLDEDTGLKLTQIRRLSNATSILMGKGVSDQSSNVPASNRENVVRIFGPHMLRFYRDISINVPAEIDQGLSRGYVQAFVALTMRWPFRNGHRSTEGFWSGIIRDDGLAANDPRKLIYRQLVVFRIRTASNGAKHTTISTVEGFRSLALAYNAYAESRMLKILKGNLTGAMRIHGVPDASEWLKA